MQSMTNTQMDFLGQSARLFFGVLLIAGLMPGLIQAQDAIFKLKSAGGNSRITGKITSMSPAGVTIDGELVPSSSIRKVEYAKEPNEISRARDQMEAGRYSDCLDELEKIKAKVNSPFVEQEIEFMRANCTASISLQGGAVVPQTAGSQVGAFIEKYQDSWQLYPAIEQYAKLLFAFGKPELAVVEFEKLANCSWPEYQIRGSFYQGKMWLILGRPAEAQAAFSAVAQVDSNDDLAQAFQLLARCESAHASGLQGDVDQARETIEGIIRDENPDNKQLFAHLYNALGDIYEKSGQLKEAARAYLHTELLFQSETESHAEALYRLALIWPKLDDTVRANRARDTLKSRYRNSYWAGKL